MSASTSERRPNVLFVMTDQQRFDTIRALGNEAIRTPNLDRLVRRGQVFTNAYSPTPVCVAARYLIHTGCDSRRTGVWSNEVPPDIHDRVRQATGGFLAERMRALGYRTFGVGKFHTTPWDADLGFDVHLHSEELYASPQQRAQDDYAAFIDRDNPAFGFLETLMGERSEMYYVPQASPLPAELGVEAWAAGRAAEEISREGDQPYFGFISFVGPHPPLAPPIPFNRMYDPDRMALPVTGDIDIDHMDDQLPWMNHATFSEDISPTLARICKARYYGEISYIDWCVGRVLAEVEARADADNTLVCFYSDHGEHLGDHHSWQKESFFEASCRVPMLVSWPARLAPGTRDDLCSLADLFGMAVGAGGGDDTRDGVDLLGLAPGAPPSRDHLLGFHGRPGSRHFKVMVRRGDWKYVFMANGGREQLFNVGADPSELRQVLATRPDVGEDLAALAIRALENGGYAEAMDAAGLRGFEFEPMTRARVLQFDLSRGVTGFPVDPSGAIAGLGPA